MEDRREKFEQSEHYAEIILRGTYLSMAADCEWILLMILARIFKKVELLKSVCGNKDLHNYTLLDRLSCVKIALEKFYPEFFKKHEMDLKELNKLRGMRNKFGHGKIDWNVNKKGYIWISEAEKSGIVKKEYKISELMKELEDYRKSISSFLGTVDLFVSKHA